MQWIVGVISFQKLFGLSGLKRSYGGEKVGCDTWGHMSEHTHVPWTCWCHFYGCCCRCCSSEISYIRVDYCHANAFRVWGDFLDRAFNRTDAGLFAHNKDWAPSSLQIICSHMVLIWHQITLSKFNLYFWRFTMNIAWREQHLLRIWLNFAKAMRSIQTQRWSILSPSSITLNFISMKTQISDWMHIVHCSLVNPLD